MKTLTLFFALAVGQLSGQWVTGKQWIFEDFDLTINQVLQTPDGGFLISATGTAPNYDSTYAMVIKANDFLDIQWAKRYRSLREDQMRCISPLSNGGFLIGGAIRQQFALYNGAGMYTIDASGQTQQALMYDGSPDDATIAAYELPDHSLLAFVRKGVSNSPAKILRLDPLGNILSQKSLHFSGNIGVLPQSVCAQGQDRFYMTGYTQNSDVGHGVAFVASFLADSLEWIREYDVGRDVSGIKIVPGNDGSVLVLGSVHDINPEVNLFHPMVMALSDAGDVQFAYRVVNNYGPFFCNGLGLHGLADGQFLLSGVRTDDLGSTAGFVMKSNPQGEIAWNYVLNDNTGQYPNLLFPLDDQRILIGANSQGDEVLLRIVTAEGLSNCYTPVANIGLEPLEFSSFPVEVTEEEPNLVRVVPDFTVSEPVFDKTVYCTGTVGLSEPPTDAVPRVFPNPTTGTVNIELPKAQTLFRIEVYDATGRLCRILHGPFSDNQINLQGLNTGIYLFALHTPKRTFQTRILVY